MSNTTVGTALAKVADILSSSDYSDKAVLILIPNITLADEAATEKVSPWRPIPAFGSHNLAY